MFVKENSDKRKLLKYFENSVSYLLDTMLRILGGLKSNREASIYYKFYLKDWFATKQYSQRILLETMRWEKKWIIIYDGTSNTQSQLLNVVTIIMKYHHTYVIHFVLLYLCQPTPVFKWEGILSTISWFLNMRVYRWFFVKTA